MIKQGILNTLWIYFGSSEEIFEGEPRNIEVERELENKKNGNRETGNGVDRNGSPM